jgi:exodeoxyribonuclease V alpha subunit
MEQTGRPARTVHRLLQWGSDGFVHGPSQRLPYKTVIVDETSMLDTTLAAALLDAVRDDSHVLFVGDVDQLPSVGPGAVLQGLISSQCVPTVRLETLYRQSEQSWIAANARRIRDGEMPVVAEDSEDFFWSERAMADDVADAIVELAVDKRHGGQLEVREVQVLCPQRSKTVCGAAALNERLQAAINPPGKHKQQWESGDRILRNGDRVMHIKNNYDLSVMNGEIGKICNVSPNTLDVDYDDRVVEYSRTDAFDLTLSYATTIHKSQGSEYPVVIVPVHSCNSYMLSRALLYTAVTRGKDAVYLVGNQKGLQRAVKNKRAMQRHTALDEKLIAAVTHG